MLINQPKGVKPETRGHKDMSCENRKGALKGKSRKPDERKTRAWCVRSWIIRLGNRTVSLLFGRFIPEGRAPSAVGP